MHEKVFASAKKSGYVRARVDGSIYDLSEDIKLDKNKKHDIEIIVDRLVMKEDMRSRLSDSVEKLAAYFLQRARISFILARGANPSPSAAAE